MCFMCHGNEAPLSLTSTLTLYFSFLSLRLNHSVQTAVHLSPLLLSSHRRRAGSELCLHHGERDPTRKHISEPTYWYITHTHTRQRDFITQHIHIHHSPPFDLSGQPFLNPDGTPAVYIPPDSQQQPIRSQTQLHSSPSQQQPQQQVARTHTHSRKRLTCWWCSTYMSQFVSLSLSPRVSVSRRWFSTRLSLTQLHKCCLSLPHSHTPQYVSVCVCVLMMVICV